MIKQILFGLLLAGGLTAQAAITPAGDKLYVVGSMTGWDIDHTDCTLSRVDGTSFYEGIIMSDEEPYFRFYTALGDWDNNSLGVQQEDAPLTYPYTPGETLSIGLTEGMGSIFLQGYGGGALHVRVDTEGMTAFIEPWQYGELEGPYIKSPQIEDGAVPNSFRSIYPGQALDAGVDYELSAVYYSPGREYTIELGVTSPNLNAGYIDFDGYVDLVAGGYPLTYVADANGRQVQVWLDGFHFHFAPYFDQKDFEPEWTAEMPSIMYCNRALYLPGYIKDFSKLIGVEVEYIVSDTSLAYSVGDGWIYFSGIPGTVELQLNFKMSDGTVKTLSRTIETLTLFPATLAVAGDAVETTGLDNVTEGIYTGTVTFGRAGEFYLVSPDKPEVYVYKSDFEEPLTIDPESLPLTMQIVNSADNNPWFVSKAMVGKPFEVYANLIEGIIEIAPEGQKHEWRFAWRGTQGDYVRRGAQMAIMNMIDTEIPSSSLKMTVEGNVDIDSENMIFWAHETGSTITVTVTTDLIEGEAGTLTRTFTVADEYPSELFFYRAANEQLLKIGSLLPDANSPYLLRGKVKFPARDKDLIFYVDGPAELGRLYTVGGGGDHIELDGGFYETNFWEFGGYGFTMPARFTDIEYNVEVNFRSNTIKFYDDDHVPASELEWTGFVPDNIRAGTAWHIPMWIESSTDFWQLIVEVSGNAIVDGSTIIVPGDSGEGSMTVTVTDPLNALTITREINIIPMFAPFYFVVDENGVVCSERYENNAGIYAGTFTVPEGTGNYNFYLSTDQYADEYIIMAREDESTDLADGLHEWATQYSTDGRLFSLDESLRGSTIELTLNLNDATLSVNKLGCNPMQFVATEDESNPRVLSVDCETSLVYHFDRYPTNARFEMQEDCGWVNNWFFDPGSLTLTLKVYVNREIDSFHIKLCNDYTEEHGTSSYFYYSSRRVALEGIGTDTESLALRQGEFGTVNVTLYPENSSDRGWWAWFEILDEDTPADGLVLNQNDNRLHVLAHKQGNYRIHFSAGGLDLAAHTDVTVLPADADASAHIFHVRLQPGDEVQLHLSGHSAREAAAVNWTVANPEVASIDSEGRLRAVTEGATMVLADCGEHKSMIGVLVGNVSMVEDIESGATAIRAYSSEGVIYVSGAAVGSEVRIYDAAGRLRGARIAGGSVETFDVGESHGVYMITNGDSALKLGM